MIYKECVQYEVIGANIFLYRALLGYGVFFAPMVFLAMVLFDSYEAMKPTLILGSIKDVFLPYCGLVILFVLVYWFLSVIGNMFSDWPVLAFMFKASWYYLALVGAGLLGRFYYHYRERLNWEV